MCCQEQQGGLSRALQRVHPQGVFLVCTHVFHTTGEYFVVVVFHTGEYFLDRGDDNENDDDSFKYDADDDETKNDNYNDTGWWQ